MSNHDKLYGRRWRKLRSVFLTENPLCVMCEQQSRVTPATIVDHIKPHKGSLELFYDLDNLQALCKPHHDGAKQSHDRTGRVRGCGEDGLPIDPDSPWNTGK